MEGNRPPEDVTRAMYAEREAWLAVAKKLPGTANYDPVLWNQWLTAAGKLTSAPGTRSATKSFAQFNRSA
jgi:hypothetical protein